MMSHTVIDTLRFANRLKKAGVEAGQAEAMSHALNDELVDGVATKQDVGNAVVELKGEIAKVDARIDAMDAKLVAIDEKFDAKFDAMDQKFEAMDAKFEAKFDAMDQKFDAKFEAVDAKFEAVDAKFVAMDQRFQSLSGQLATQGRYVFLVLALVVGLGVYNAVAPHFAGKPPASSVVAAAPESRGPAPAGDG